MGPSQIEQGADFVVLCTRCSRANLLSNLGRALSDKGYTVDRLMSARWVDEPEIEKPGLAERD